MVRVAFAIDRVLAPFGLMLWFHMETDGEDGTPANVRVRGLRIARRATIR